ncbi:hypothetical protein SLEP1_g47343 [Rubroshorea leprosula]|uniref:Uncharacterized protein n=1 Tax=Rubroshorea leprosula TaxID=152421 RepID=A0AAV5LQ67_9ROSI|nr:hypothetical protein SLEP1_g47343 [Rubroshorea leprosula]
MHKEKFRCVANLLFLSTTLYANLFNCLKFQKDGTNESFDAGMLTGYLAGSSNVASNNEGELQSSSTWTMPLTAGAMNCTGIGTPSEPPISGREEELAEVRRGKMPATVDNCAPPLLPISGSQSSKFMASASQTACQSAFADDGNWKMAQYAPKQHVISYGTCQMDDACFMFMLSYHSFGSECSAQEKLSTRITVII